MQESTIFQPIQPQFPEQEQLKCPRCDSTNTKFCYYNNYNLSQPRHLCKNCRRYWTKGGALRNIPVGGGSRKNAKRASNPKRSSTSSTSSSSSAPVPPTLPPVQKLDSDPTGIYSSNNHHNNNNNSAVDHHQHRRMLEIIPGSFSSLLASNGQFGNLLEGLNHNGSDLKMVQMGDFAENLNSASDHNSALELQRGNNNNSQNFNNNNMQNGGDSSSCWGHGNGWPDLSIYTPGSFQ